MLICIEKKLIGARDFFPAHNNNETQNTFAKRSFVFTVHFFKHTTALSRRSSESECVCVVLILFMFLCCVCFMLCFTFVVLCLMVIEIDLFFLCFCCFFFA